MNYVLKLDRRLKDELWRHLLGESSQREQAAFLYCSQTSTGEGIVFDVVDYELLERSDFAVQYSDCLELADEARVRIIKRAHAHRACLVEVHSHRWDWPAEFSLWDQVGLKETVPHMRWRLKERPYLAVVVAQTSYDALVWVLNGDQPNALVVEVDGERLLPTGRSLGSWNGRR